MTKQMPSKSLSVWEVAISAPHKQDGPTLAIQPLTKCSLASDLTYTTELPPESI